MSNRNLSLKEQFTNALYQQNSLGHCESRHQDKKAAVKSNLPADTYTGKKIYSDGALKTYKSCCVNYANYCTENHHCHTIRQSIKYLDEYLATYTSASTRATIASAVCKALGLHYAQPSSSAKKKADADVILHNIGIRHSAEIKKNRGWTETNCSIAQYLAKHTGGRRRDILNLRSTSLSYDANGNAYVTFTKSKGGKSRTAPILNNDARTIDIIKNLGPKGLKYINSNDNVHLYRQDYAKIMYRSIARPVNMLNADHKLWSPGHHRKMSEVYKCRGERSEEAYDRKALIKVSNYLGHNREDVVVTSYMRFY